MAHSRTSSTITNEINAALAGVEQDVAFVEQAAAELATHGE